MRQVAFPKNVAKCKISLDQGNFFDTDDALVIAVEGPAKGFEAGNNALPRVLRHMFLRRVIGGNYKVDEDIYTITVSAMYMEYTDQLP